MTHVRRFAEPDERMSKPVEQAIRQSQAETAWPSPSIRVLLGEIDALRAENEALQSRLDGMTAENKALQEARSRERRWRVLVLKAKAGDLCPDWWAETNVLLEQSAPAEPEEVSDGRCV